MDMGQSAPSSFLRLSPDVHVQVEGDLLLLIGEAALLEFPDASRRVEPAIRALKAGASVDSLLGMIDAPFALDLLKELFELRWVHFVRQPECTLDPRYEQVLRWLSSVTASPDESMARIFSKSIVILGVGGLGIQVLQHLIGLGLRSALIIDGDVVEASNLNRQYGYGLEDIGKFKAEVAANVMIAQVPSARVRAIVRQVASVEDLQVLDGHEFDFLVNCADQPSDLDAIVGGYAERRNVPVITGGVGLHRGFWGPLALPGGDAPNVRAPKAQVGPYLIPRLRCVSSHGPYNSIVAALIAHDVFAYLSGCASPRSAGRTMTIDFSTLEITVGQSSPGVLSAQLV